MNSIIIEPGLPFDTQKLIQLIKKLSLEARLETDIIQPSNKGLLTHSIEGIIGKSPDTIVALGSYAWLDSIISESCRLSHADPKTTPIFAHVSPPERLALTWRIAPYMERSLKRSIQAIAARKITKQKAFVCANILWFTHTLHLKSNIQTAAPNRFIVRTSRGSEFRINAPAEDVIVTVQEDITSHNQHTMTIRAQKNNSIASSIYQSKDTSLLEKPLRSKSIQKTPEEVFHIQASQVDIHTPHKFSSTTFPKSLPEKFRIEPSKFMIKIITEKNDILKY